MSETEQKVMAESAAKIRQLETALDLLTRENADLKRQLDHMNELLVNAQRTRFGQSSEKRTYVMGDGSKQLSMFNEAEAEQSPKAPEPDEKTILIPAHQRKPKRTYDEMLKDIPVQEVYLDMPEDGKVCTTCGEPLVRAGKKLIRRELQIIPQKVTVLEYYAFTYICRNCEKTSGYANIYTVKAPPPLMKHSLASPSTVADVMTKKYVEGLPLARQEKMWKRIGVELSRATLSNWVIYPAQTWLKPLYRRMKKLLLESSVIHADETVVQVLKEPDKSPTSESRMWVYATPERSGIPIRYFEYQPDRKGCRPRDFPKGFTGCLVTDGYAGYNQVLGVTHCGCWAHVRRKWREAMPKGATTKTSKAAIGYEYCNKLFALERKYAKMSDAVRKTARQAEVEPLLDVYWLWLGTVHPESGSKLEEAVNYSLNQKEQLSAFLTHGQVEISNNHAENAIRPFVVGRKNWLFSDTVKGADSSAIVYTLVESAKANGIDPYAYLLLLLNELRYHGKTPANAVLDRYMPWQAYVRNKCEQTDESE